MAKVRVQAAELQVQESLDDVMTKVANADAGVHRAGVRVSAPGWITLTDATVPNRELYVQVGQIGYLHEDD